MNEYERYINYRRKRQIKPAARISRKNKKATMIDNYILQRQDMLEVIEERDKMIVDKKDFDSFVGQAAAAIKKALR